MKHNIEKLLGLHSPSFQKPNIREISKATNIAYSTLRDYAIGTSSVNNMRLEHATILNNYYLKGMDEMKMKELANEVNDGTVLSESNGVYYADVVEDNGDEHRLAESDSVESLREQLKAFGQIK